MNEDVAYARNTESGCKTIINNQSCPWMVVNWVSLKQTQSKSQRSQTDALNQSKFNVTMDMLPTRIAGKILRAHRDWFCFFFFWLDNKVTRVFFFFGQSFSVVVKETNATSNYFPRPSASHIRAAERIISNHRDNFAWQIYIFHKRLLIEANPAFRRSLNP